MRTRHIDALDTVETSFKIPEPVARNQAVAVRPEIDSRQRNGTHVGLQRAHDGNTAPQGRCIEQTDDLYQPFDQGIGRRGTDEETPQPPVRERHAQHCFQRKMLSEKKRETIRRRQEGRHENQPPERCRPVCGNGRRDGTGEGFGDQDIGIVRQTLPDIANQ